MRICNGLTQIPIPQWITISASTLSAKTQTGKINGLHGEQLVGDEYYSVRMLKCSGTIITENYPLVEKERSRLQDMLSGKLLRVYRSDSDDVFYECMLDGQVSVTYYNGRNISKAFTISFNLKTLTPFAYTSRSIKANRLCEKKYIVLQGNDITYPAFFFCRQKRYDKLLVVCNERRIALKNPLYLRNDESLFYSECRLYINRNGSNQNIGTDRSSEAKAAKELVDISSFLAADSITQPLYLHAGVNELSYHSGGTCIVFYHDVYK